MRVFSRSAPTLIMLATLATPGIVGAQSNVSTGMLHGSVVDSSGVPLPGATIEARQAATGFVRRTTSDASGTYRINLLPTGVYDLHVTRVGFNTEVRRGVAVTLGSRARIDIVMAMSTFQDEVVVTAAAPLVETGDSSVAASVGEAAIANLPLVGRDFEDLVLLTPGSVAGRGEGSQREVRGGMGVNIGARSVQNSFNIDGATAQSSYFGNERGGGHKAFSFSQAAIEEFRVIRSSYGLQYSAGGAVINAVTKSGSNDLHGEVFGYYRDENLVDADALGRKADDFRQIQYGFALGGPVVRDRLHYFLSFDEQDLDEPSFREFAGFPDGREGDWEALTGLDWERETGLVMGLDDSRVMLLKLDWQLADLHLLTTRYNALSVPDNENTLNSRGTAGWSNEGRAEDSYDSLVISLNSVLSSHLVNEAFAQHSLEKRPRYPNVTSIAGTIVGGFSTDGAFGQNTGLPSGLDERRWQLVDNLGYSLPEHTLTAGINLELVEVDNLFLQTGGGFYRFSSWEAFLDGGTPFLYQQAFSDSGGRMVFDTSTYAVYVQDEWRPTADIGLVFGLRYDLQDHDQPRSANPLYPLTAQIPNDHNNVSARGGFAWDLSGDGRGVLRGGIGLFYDANPTVLDNTAMQVNGIEVVRVTSLCLSGDPCPSYPDRWDTSADLPLDSGPDIFVFDPGFQNPETLRMSLGYEREIASDLSLGIDLVYSRSRHLARKQDRNLLPTEELTVDGRTVYLPGNVHPELGRIIMYRSDARAHHRSLVIRAHKRLSKGWFVDASYTWSKTRDNDSSERSVHRNWHYPEDHYDLGAEWGSSDFDVRHQIVISGGVLLPYGFMVSGHAFVRSGFPYSAYHSDDLNGDGYFESERSVIETGPGVFFHYPRNTFRQEWFSQLNLRLSKSFRLGGQFELQLIGEVFNLLGTANWYTTRWKLSQGCTFDDGEWVPCRIFDDFGENNIPGSPREFQLGLRLKF